MMTMLCLKELGPLKAGSIIKNIVKTSYCKGNTDIGIFSKKIQGVIP